MVRRGRCGDYVARELPCNGQELPATIKSSFFNLVNFWTSQHYSPVLVQPEQYQTMLDAFEIVTTSGVVLWSRSYAPVSSHIVNSLISEVFIEEKVVPTEGVSNAFKKEKYTLKWRRAKDLGLIFVVCDWAVSLLMWSCD